MDPYNNLCNQIGAMSACDYQRMYNFSNYPTANNGYYSGTNYGIGGSVFGYNTDINYTANADGTSYSYSNKPSNLMIGLGIAGAVGSVFAAIGAGKAAVEQQKAIQEQQQIQYEAYQEQSAMLWAAQNQQLEKQKSQENMTNMMNMMMMMKMMEKMDI